MTRVSQNHLLGMLQFGMAQNRVRIAQHTEEISSGYKIQTPGDTVQPGLINQFREIVGRMDSHLDRIQTVTGGLEFQEGVLNESENLVQRALELASQGANETYSTQSRAGMAEEIFGLRDQLISLANSTYQGAYVFGGGRDETPPFVLQSPAPPGYVNPATGPASQRYAYTTALGATTTRTADVNDTLSVRVNTDGSTVFTQAIDALERLGRALAGYRTDPPITPPTPAASPDGNGVAYVFPTDYNLQSDEIRQTIDLLKGASRDQIGVERTSIGARINQLKAAKSVVEAARGSARESLSRLQDTDIAESATNLTQAKTALEATMTVSGQVLRLSILDYL